MSLDLKTQQEILIADKFSKNLIDSLDDHEIQSIIQLNNTEHYSTCCATHNYCDANMPMSDAFEEVVGREINLQSEEDIMLWNMAWKRARDNDFYYFDQD